MHLGPNEVSVLLVHEVQPLVSLSHRHKGVECAFVVLNTPRTYCHANLHALEEFHCS